MTVRVGFLGYRFMGRAHANALARLPLFFPEAPAVERSVLIGRDEDGLSEAVDRLGFDRYVTDWAAAIDEIDVLYNLGPNNLHAAPSIAALEEDVDVFCEKPLAHTLDAAEEMAAAARASNATTGIAFNYRFVPAIQLARELIDRGELGEIYHVRARYLQDGLADPEAAWSWRNDESVAGSGALGDLGAHSIDLAQFLLADRVERVSGHLRTFVDERPVPDEAGRADDSGTETRPVTVDDAFSAQATFAGGAMGTFEASRMATGHDNSNVIEVNGSKGSLRFDLERLNELDVRRPDGRGFETVLVTEEDDPYGDRWWPAGHVLGWEHTFVHENYEFLSAVASGDGYAPDFSDGLAVQRVLAAIEKSDASESWVTV
ncbi:gfo/Idh/MocA family oxidoreductase [Halorhabdus sp. CBA1104]|uniref:Gfo/Idh/MocA family protein n=1 Tax=Halorhabdus sp. CBA1104 TaxID=1380432 RepID=UPI0012B320AC|nr:Gfo/Idh/MocA family oxidoreductase [Halorhabdus sp. CBA1104]QGN07078.1 gfo/Idh/MocA family oxidoreductase [Halorhabdus sp. CBA1104]